MLPPVTGSLLFKSHHWKRKHFTRRLAILFKILLNPTIEKANKIYVLIPDPVIDRFVNFGEHVKCFLKIYFSSKIHSVNKN
jgi:hypothetical protein